MYTYLGHIYISWSYLHILVIYTHLGHIYISWSYIHILIIFTHLGHIYISRSYLHILVIYTYLGHIVDKSLTLRKNFEAACKKCCNRVQLLSAITIYQSIILPKLQFTKTQLNKFQSIDRRA